MGSIDSKSAALQIVSSTAATESALAPKVQAASAAPAVIEIPAAPSPKAQQDTVSLSGTLPPQQRQQNAPSPGIAQQAGTQFPIATATPGAAATASATSAPSTAPPQQTLQQVDRVLRQLGIDPQTLSLISREGMLNWVNDPAALRRIVQNVQSAANSSRTNAAAGAANPTRSTKQLSVASASQIQSQTQNQAQASAQETNPASSGSSAASSANVNALDQSAATAQQNAAAVMQFPRLQDSFTPSARPGGQLVATNPGGRTTPQGQLLNVCAELSRCPANLFKLNHV
jgi:hypothetical protein